jgi:hypothetical protein
VGTQDSGAAEQFRLSTTEMFTLHALRRQMMRTDLRNEKNAKARERKREIIRNHHSEFLAAMGSVDDESLIAEVNIADAAKRLAGSIGNRSRAMILLVDLMTFNPWHPEDKWVPAARKEALKTAADELAGLNTDDLAAATREFDALSKELRQKSIKWGRVAAIGVVGAAVGIATGGLAAPYIGGMIGASMGLSGAAATSAGLAALGGGSLAAGGFGVFGGTILVGGVGGVVAGGAAGAATRYSPAGTGEVVLDAIKLELISKLVLNDSPDGDQKKRRVVEGLNYRLNELSEKINLLSELIVEKRVEITRLRDEKAQIAGDNDALSDELRGLKQENNALREELNKLKEARTAAKEAVTTLEVIRDRIAEPVP